MKHDGLFEVLLSLIQEVPNGTSVVRAASKRGTTFVYKDGIEIVGVLHLQSSGVFVVAVRASHQKQGIGTALLKAANEYKPIDFSKSSYSLEGEALVQKFLGGNENVCAKYDIPSKIQVVAIG